MFQEVASQVMTMATAPRQGCGRCHECGAMLLQKPGYEWCRVCEARRVYISHGFSPFEASFGSEECPDWDQVVVGRRDPRDGVVVELGGKVLIPSDKHSSEFGWGYGGSGPAELAWCILEAVVGRRAAEVCYQSFKWGTIAELPRPCWQLSVERIKQWCRDYLKAERYPYLGPEDIQ